jgi:hypothetical protein
VSAEWYASLSDGVNVTRSGTALAASRRMRHTTAGRALGIGINAALRLTIVGGVAHALLNPGDHRYAGKGIGTRGLVVVAASLLIPVLQRTTRRGERYPLTTDNLYLSIFALDLAGNYLDLYDRFVLFDLVPHFHGTGAASIVIASLTRRPLLAGIGIAQIGHIGLEAQEYYSDVLFDLHNVRGTWDTVNDLLAGAAGSVTYAAFAHRRWSRRGHRAQDGVPAR